MSGDQFEFAVIEVDTMTEWDKLQDRLDKLGSRGFQLAAAAPAGAGSFLILQREQTRRADARAAQKS